MSHVERRLGWAGAIFNALLNRKISYYPRFVKGTSVERIIEPQILAQITSALKDVETASPELLKSHLERGRETLNEVKALTEYQDAKATRLLTIIAFLSALAGVIFGRFADAYPLKPTVDTYGLSVNSAIVIIDYLCFALFVLAIVSGALVTFHATLTRFKYPELSSDLVGAEDRRADSHLFYSDMIELCPAAWAKSFIVSKSATGAATLDPDLALHYVKNYIAESYLIACKVADKLRYLQPAQTILSFSIRTLLIWVLLFGVTSAIVPVTKLPSTVVLMK